MRLTELIDRRCTTDDGRVLGRVFELRATRHGGELLVTHLLLGRLALVERYGAGRHRPPANRRGDVIHEVAWDDVVRIERGRIIVRTPHQESS